MKTTLPSALCLFVAIVPSYVTGQNLVPNPSFEILAGCPENPGDVQLAAGWTSFGGSPDLFNACNQNSWYDVPLNLAGYQFASEGVGYAGVLTYQESQGNSREYLGAALTQSLTVGQPVFITIKVAMAAGGWSPFSPRLSASGVGVFFSTVPWSATDFVIPNWTALALDPPSTDTASWITVTGQYLPDSAYAFVIVGNPFDDTLIDTATVDTSSSALLAYTFVDEVCVSTTGSCLISGNGVGDIGTENVGLYPNPFGDQLTVLIPTGLGLIDYEVYSVDGRRFSEGTFNAGARTSLDMNSLPAGVLLFRFSNADTWSATRTVIHITPH